MSWITFHLMQFFWKLSEIHWVFKPFSWLGDRLEDFVCRHELLELAQEAIEESRAEYLAGRADG